MYQCSKCGAQSLGWQGRCPECGGWGSLVESEVDSCKIKQKISVTAKPGSVIDFSDVKNETIKRIMTNIDELDRTLGGGIVPGSVILLGGEPGIGKSTLVLEIAAALGGEVLYVSGEESAGQIKSRLERLGIKGNKIKYLGDTETNTICATIDKLSPMFVIIDSIQTIAADDVSGEMGGVSQIRASTAKLLGVAKNRNIPILIIGHITKDGEVAGPKTLEHLVDTVLYLEGEKFQSYRILRSVKNRFGSTGETGVFAMNSDGLKEVSNPSEIFLSPRQHSVSGSIVTVIMEGSRPFLVEVQALVSKTPFGYPKRSTSGYDLNRMQLILSVLTKRVGLNLESQDVHVNIAGGLKVQEPAADLAVALAIVSSFKNKAIDAKSAAWGEIGLGGELRPVGQSKKRLDEAQKMGFKNIIEPAKAKTLNEAIEFIM